MESLRIFCFIMVVIGMIGFIITTIDLNNKQNIEIWGNTVHGEVDGIEVSERK